MRFLTKVLGLGAACCLAVASLGVRAAPPAGTNADPNKATPNGTSASGVKAPRFDAARFLKDHDKNHDGKLSKDELPPAAQKEFDQMDANKDGFVTSDELQQYAARKAQQRPQLVEVVLYAIDVPEEPVTTQELQAAYDQLRKLDKNGDGRIDDKEVQAFRDQRKQERIDEIFAALDQNKDGKISKDEARGLWADNFAQLDKNGDGSLDRHEVEAALGLKLGNGQAHTSSQAGQLNSNAK